MEQIEKLIYKRGWVEISMDITGANTTEFFNSTLEMMRLLWYEEECIIGVIKNFDDRDLL